MPIYVYRPISKSQCDHCEDGFEQLQKLDDEPLAICPECEAPVEKLITAANLASSAPSLKEGNIEQHGFTQYRKVEKGVYEKTAGKGPGLITSDEPVNKESQ
jgi:putative FmdB family regulatory protein